MTNSFQNEFVILIVWKVTSQIKKVYYVIYCRQNKENLDKKQSNGLIQQQIRVRREEGYAAAERRQMSKMIDLCCVEGQEIQGSLIGT